MGGKFRGGDPSRPSLQARLGLLQPRHGWIGLRVSIGWAMAWNVSSSFALVQQPPGSLNCCTGCIGTPVTIWSIPNGTFDSPGKMVEPASLYLQQLRDRVGPDGVRNIGY